MNAVIVGATGMIGTAISAAMVQNGCNVTAVARNPLIAAATLPAGILCVGLSAEKDGGARTTVLAEIER